jgi:NAD(P)-dependent dehydrogenase (short-subunit alcohol dehydrogenase family)
LDRKYCENICTFSLDVTNEAQAKAAFEEAIASFGGLDVLVKQGGGYGKAAQNLK